MLHCLYSYQHDHRKQNPAGVCLQRSLKKITANVSNIYTVDSTETSGAENNANDMEINEKLILEKQLTLRNNLTIEPHSMHYN